MVRPSFTAHPASVGETYGQHFRSACKFSAQMISAGVACLFHGIFPFLFVSTGSSTVRKLYDRMVVNRTRTLAEGTGMSVTPSADKDNLERTIAHRGASLEENPEAHD